MLISAEGAHAACVSIFEGVEHLRMFSMRRAERTPQAARLSIAGFVCMAAGAQRAGRGIGPVIIKFRKVSALRIRDECRP